MSTTAHSTIVSEHYMRKERLEDQDDSPEKKSRSNAFDVPYLLYHHHRRHSIGMTVTIRDHTPVILAVRLRWI
jgi:hypothetical protein